jgi:hypothetical protein
VAKDVTIKISAKNMASTVMKAVSDSVKKMGEQVAATTKKVAASAAAMGKAFKSAATFGLSAFSGMGAAVSSFGVVSAAVFARVGDSIDKMAKRSGIGVEALQGLRFAAEQSGSSIDVVEKSIFKLDRAIGDAIGGSTALQDDFARLGVDVNALSQMTPEQQLGVMADALMAIENPAERAAIGARLMGRGFEELQPLLQEGSQGINALISEYDQFGVALSATDVSAAAELTDAFNRISTVVRGFIVNVGAKFAPTLTEIANKFAELSAPIMKVINELDISSTLQPIVDGISSAVARITAFITDNLNVIRGFGTTIQIVFEVVSTAISTAKSAVSTAFGIVSGGLGDFQSISKAVLTGFVTGLTFVETTVANLPLVFEMFKLQSQLSFTSLVEDLKHGFTKVLPNAVKAFGVVVGNAFKAMVKGGINLFRMMVDKVVGLLQKIAAFDPTGIVNAHIAALEQGSKFLDLMSDSVAFAEAPAPVQARAETRQEASLRAGMAEAQSQLNADFEQRLGPRLDRLSESFNSTGEKIEFVQEESSSQIQDTIETAKTLATSGGVQAAQSRLLTRGIARDPQKELVTETKKQTAAAQKQVGLLELLVTAFETAPATEIEVVQ